MNLQLIPPHTQPNTTPPLLRKKTARRQSTHLARNGFTIIEVLIVLAIAGLILLIVFLAVPALQRNSRNYSRKNFVNLTAAELATYATNNQGAYPNDAASMCTFITDYLKSESGGSTGPCSATFNSVKNCVLVTTARYTICYHDKDTTPHSYTGPADEISIMLGHWCNTGSHYYAGDSGAPVTSGGSTIDGELQRYAIWTTLENSATQYCLDNYPT